MKEANGIAGSNQFGNHRLWRVGSISTGVTLILMGVALAVSLWNDSKAYEALSWIAPIIFILLGAEVLIYLTFAGSGKTGVRYDWFSIFVVGIISAASLVLSLLMSTGIFDELQRGLHMMQRSAAVSPQAIQVPEHINKIVVQTLSHVEYDETDTRELQLFGQVRYWSKEELDLSEVSLLQTNTVGSTMYVMIGAVERRDGGLFPDTVDPQLTLALPENVEVIWR